MRSGCWRAARVAMMSVVAFLFAGCSASDFLADFTGFDGSPSWSPDGSRIAYAHWNSPSQGPDKYPTGLYLLDPATGERERLLADFSVGTDWSPDGRQLVCAIRNALYRLNLETRELSLVCAKSARYPSWSAGDTIAFDDAERVWLVGAAGGDPRRLRSADAAPGGGREPEWSPDGRSLLVLLQLDPGSTNQLCQVDREGILLRRLTRNLRGDYGPAWSPRGDRIAWNRWSESRPRTIGAELCVMDSSGAGVMALPEADIDLNGDVAWSPDGESLLFVGNTPAGQRIFVIDRDGGNLRRITQ